MKKRMICLSCLCGLVLAVGSAGAYSVGAPSRITAVNAAETDSNSAGVSISNAAIQAGVPIRVSMNGIITANASYKWTVGGKIVGADSDSYTPTADDYEKMITVTVTADGKEYSASVYFSELPVVYINTAEEITSKTEYIAGTCSIQGNSEFSNTARLYNGSIQIRGRGNYTWVHDKKPYKIKLDTKTDIFGMGESKHWVLMAEYMDPTHLRNEIMPELSETLGFDYTANSEAVAVVLTVFAALSQLEREQLKQRQR